MDYTLDVLDQALLTLLLERPRDGLRKYARTLGVARGTVTARFARLQELGIVTSLTPRINPSAFGYAVLSFVYLYLMQGRLNEVVESVALVPEVVQAHTVTGDEDLLCQVVARNQAHFEEVVLQLIALPGVGRTRSEITLTERVPYRLLPLVRSVAPRSSPSRARVEGSSNGVGPGHAALGG